MLLSGLDDEGQLYPLIIATRHGQGTAILSAESFGANFNSYMQKCAGHPSMWLARAMNLRDFFRSAVLDELEPRLPGMMQATGNVAAYWWQSEDGLAAWVINHEYSECQTVQLDIKHPGQGAVAEVYFGRLAGQSKRAGRLMVEVEVAPASMTAVIVKNPATNKIVK